ncbi:2,3-diaminopropionate biosynthesis protein SbnA [Streptomyces sp. NPDC045251]|uniref:2,3-diaminopropionate biosynthesis protein SbnA n=1 Tax=unclassified Streptomyces TaxID=2593676 RepID=UPI0033FB212F
MTVISGAHELLDTEVYVDLRDLLGTPLYLKCEGFNFAGSVKMRPAVWMVAAAQRDGVLDAGSTLIESSSGNLGVALAVVAAAKGIRFLCVTDPKCNPSTARLIRALGAEVITVDEPDAEGSYLAARKEYVRRKCAADPSYVWLNQYENPANWISHYENTAAHIAKRFPALDTLFIGTGTGGTLMGCARYFREHRPAVRIIGVDTEGSVNFSGTPGPRHIPGLGASTLMPLIDEALLDEVIRVPETEAVGMCRRLASKGLLFGGSTGTVVSAAARWLGGRGLGPSHIAVAIAPDLGERYIDSIYHDAWVAEHYGRAPLELLEQL